MGAGRYNLKNYPVMAIRLMADEDVPLDNNAAEVADFCKGEAVWRYNAVDKSTGISVEFTDSNGLLHHVFFGDWVVQGVGGHIKVVDDESFEVTYIWDPSTEDYPSIGPECFADKDGTVISYQGENYYRGCGIVVQQMGGSNTATTTCVKPVDHYGKLHEDFHGNVKEMED